MASDSAAWSRAQLYLVRGIAVAALGLIATAAYADEDTDALPTRLPEIVVTAQKLNQTLEQVPVSVGTLDGALMDQSGASGFPDLQEIGRASGRERGCQYVEIWVVAVSLKKKRTTKV